jgi:hypothetical protein
MARRIAEQLPVRVTYPHLAHRVTVLLGSTVRLLASLMHGQALPLANDALELFSLPGVLSLRGSRLLQRAVCILRKSYV